MQVLSPLCSTVTLCAYRNGAITRSEDIQITARIIRANKKLRRRLNGKIIAQKRSNVIARRVRIELATETLWKNTTSLHNASPNIHFHPRYSCVIMFGIPRNVMRRSLAARLAMKRFVTLRMLMLRHTVSMTTELPASDSRIIKQYARVFTACVVNVS